MLCLGLAANHTLENLRAAIPDWNVTTVHDVAAASRLLKRSHYPIGMVVISDTAEADHAAIDALVGAHSGMHWVGVVPPGATANHFWRDLIVDHFADYHTLPIDAKRLNESLGHSLGMAMLRQGVTTASPPPLSDETLVGQGSAMTRLLAHLRKVARVEAPVLVTGESGTGKELTAQAIHRYSSRASRAFIPVNCAAIPAPLIQSELFGYERGAFTGASQAKQGYFEAAEGGTLFLDEIADLSIELQTNLLRFLQEKTINRVGSTQSISIDVRIIAATNIDLEEAVRQGRFRKDLFYRLNVLSLAVPPLRDRKEDIEPLANYFFRCFSTEKNPRVIGFARRALFALETHDWPGNVRELNNRVRRAMVMAEGRLITAADLGLERRSQPGIQEGLGEIRVTAERDAIVAGLHRAQRNVTRAARELGVSRMTLYRLMAKHSIEV